MVVAEIELGGVAVQMGFGNVVIRSDDPALEDREVIFDRVGVPELRANVFLGAVVDGAVAVELAPDLGIDRCIVWALST